LDSLPPAPLPSPPAITADAPGDIYPRSARERELCDSASRPDFIYLGGLLALDMASFWGGVQPFFKYSDSLPIRFLGPIIVGTSWGATVGGAWLALPKCSPEWVAETPREGQVRARWPLAIALATLAGITAPVVNAIALGNCSGACINNLPANWTTFEREMHIVAAGFAGFGGALLPYLLPPRTLSAARELDRIRFEADGHGAYVQYVAAF
jgi:hypothetical protein